MNITDLINLRRETIEDCEKDILESEQRIKQLEDSLFEENAKLEQLKKELKRLRN